MELFWAIILCMVKVGSQKNNTIFISYFFNTQIWLYRLLYDCHRDYITKLKKQNMVQDEETRNHAVDSTYLLIIWQWEQRIQWEQQSQMLTGQWRTMLLHVLTITLSASVPNQKERSTANCHPFWYSCTFDTSFILHEVCHKALKEIFTSLYDGHLIFVHSFSSNRKEER
jgi:hypothetical protein